MSILGGIGKAIAQAIKAGQKAQAGALKAVQADITAIAQVVLVKSASYKTSADIRAAATAETIKRLGAKPLGQDPVLVSTAVLTEVVRLAPPTALKTKAFQDLKKEQDAFQKAIDGFFNRH